MTMTKNATSPAGPRAGAQGAGARREDAPRARAKRPLFAPLACVALAAACGGSSFQTTANITGTYDVSLTNGANGCQFASWTTGAMVSNIGVDITQNGTNASAQVTGLAALVYAVDLGTATFTGSVQGDTFTMTAFGSHAATDGQCSYTLKASMTGTQLGDSVQGQLTYSETTNGSPDCGYHATCTSVQSFAGVRPPSADGG
jgi:hypothetical protein